MKKFFDEAFIFVFLVIPFLLIYAKGIDYYNEVVIEPAVGMKCANGEPIETWVNTERILIPTHNCHTFEHYINYTKWLAMKIPELLSDNNETIDKVINYFKEIMVIIVELLTNVIEFFLKKFQG